MVPHGRLKSQLSIQQNPIYQSSGRPVSVEGSIQMDDLLVILVSKTAHTFDLTSQKFQPITIADEKLKLNHIQHCKENVFGFNDNSFHIIDTLGQAHLIGTINEPEKITAAYCDVVEDDNYVVQFATNTDSDSKNVYEFSVAKDKKDGGKPLVHHVAYALLKPPLQSPVFNTSVETPCFGYNEKTNPLLL